MEIRPVFIALPNDELFEVCFIVWYTFKR
jgi:hypothetical protein